MKLNKLQISKGIVYNTFISINYSKTSSNKKLKRSIVLLIKNIL